MRWVGDLTNDQEKPWNLKHRRVDLVHLLQRPVEITAESSHSNLIVTKFQEKKCWLDKANHD